MGGQSYSKMGPGDGCWLIVDSANHPPGVWKGEVLETEERGGWFGVRAKITDARVEQHEVLEVRAFFNSEPAVNYSVIPSNKEFDWLVRRITRLEEKLQRVVNRAADRERLLFTALEHVARGARTVEEVRETLSD